MAPVTAAVSWFGNKNKIKKTNTPPGCGWRPLGANIPQLEADGLLQTKRPVGNEASTLILA